MMAQVLEAVRALEEGVLTDIREGDVGAILGWGFAPWSGGPFSWLDMIGAAKAVEICDALDAAHGARFAAPDAAARHGRDGRELLRPLRPGQGRLRTQSQTTGAPAQRAGAPFHPCVSHPDRLRTKHERLSLPLRRRRRLPSCPPGALWWPAEGLLCVSDLHLGRSERFARNAGALLPPYEIRDTLARLEADIEATAARDIRLPRRQFRRCRRGRDGLDAEASALAHPADGRAALGLDRGQPRSRPGRPRRHPSRRAAPTAR